MTPQQAASVVMLRRRARDDLVTYASRVPVPGSPIEDADERAPIPLIESRQADHHRLMLREMQRCMTTPHGRLMIFAPPGSAKSTYATVVAPSWYLGRQPDRRVILASYGDELARRHGRRTRQLVSSREHAGIMRCNLQADQRAAEAFALTNGSEYLACGILAGVTGNRAHGIVIDDPIKGRQQADSPATREATWSAYQDDLKTRLIPGGWVTMILTRWHEDDLAGRILPTGWKGESGNILCKDGQVWRVLCLQAECQTDTDPMGRARGGMLWPEWFDSRHWDQFRPAARTWASLYQQIPAPLDGGLFKPHMIQIVDAAPAGTHWCRGWDFGATTDGDPTAGALIGRAPDGRFVIGGMEWGRWGPDERDACLINTARRDGRIVRISIPQDPGQAGKTQGIYLTRQLAGYRVTCTPETGDKVTRAEPFAAQVNAGNVLMVRGDYGQRLMDEMRVFPNGAHDDQVDACGRAFAEVMQPIRLQINQAAIDKAMNSR